MIPVDAFPFLIASGNHMTATSEYCDAGTLRGSLKGEEAAKDMTLVQAFQALGGSRPLWHPDILKLLLANGRLATVAKLLRSLLAILQKVTGLQHDLHL